jgi:hypothetical protein
MINKFLFLLWSLLCIADAAGISIGICLSHFDILILAVLLLCLLPILYQLGLDYADFEECSKIFELEDDDENDSDS